MNQALHGTSLYGVGLACHKVCFCYMCSNVIVANVTANVVACVAIAADIPAYVVITLILHVCICIGECH